MSEYYGEGNGLVLLTVAETQFNTEADNVELKVADYYTPAHKQPEHKHKELNCKIIFEGQPKLLTAQKICSAKFFNNIGTEVNTEPVWDLTAENGDGTDIVELTEFEDGSVGLKRVTGYADTGKKVALTLKDSDEICEDTVVFQLA